MSNMTKVYASGKSLHTTRCSTYHPVTPNPFLSR